MGGASDKPDRAMEPRRLRNDAASERFAGKRILIVSQYFAPEDFRINRVVAALVERGATCVVLTGLPNYPKGRFHDGYGLRGPYTEEICGARVLRLPVVPRGRGGLSMMLNFASYTAMAMLAGPWRLRKERFDVVLNWLSSPVYPILPSLVLGRIKSAPVVSWVLDIWPESLLVTGMREDSLLYRSQGWISTELFRRCDRLLLTSDAFRAPLAKRGVEDRRMIEFPNFAEEIYEENDLSDVAPAPELAAIVAPGVPTITYAGNVGQAQGVGAWLRAAAQLRSEGRRINWIYLGAGRDLEATKALAHELALGGCVHFLGQFPQQRMPSFLKASDAMLVSLKPSAISALTIPGRIQSFLAMGRPMLAAIEGAAAELIRASGGGMVADPGDEAAIVDMVRTFVSMSPLDRESMGLAGRAYYRGNLTIEHLLGRLGETFQDLAAERRP